MESAKFANGEEIEMGMEVGSLKLKNRSFGNWHREVENHWDYDDMIKDDGWRKDWISFDCLCYVKQQNTIYAGITSFDADIFWGYNRSSRQWVPTGYERIVDKYDAKFHRSLVFHEGCLYGGVALLHDIDRYWDAPGGAIVKYDVSSGKIEKLGIPIPHHYIQSMVLDKGREIIYGQTFTPERLFSFDLSTGKSRDIGPIGSGMEMGQGENLVLDSEGNVWGAWSVTRAWQDNPGVDSIRLFRYRADQERIEYLKEGLPRPDSSYGNVKIEGLFNFDTGCLYASGGNGALYRIAPESGQAEYLFSPVVERRSRLASMALGDDGYAYGVVGRDGQCELLRFDPAKESYELLGEIVDQDGVRCWQVHDLVVLPDGTLYAGENDVPHRSGYLWEIKIK